MSPAVRSKASGPDAPPIVGGPAARPIMLATLAVPFESESVRVAFQAALETNVQLLVVDVVERPLWPLAATFGRAELELDDDREQIRRLVAQAAGLGIQVEHLRVRSPRPVEALLEVAGERRARLLVLGPDPCRFKPRFFQRVVRKIRRRASCLVWIAGEGP
ncbi:MAG TPA: universal stress protein [Gaiellales bacterium]|nr:universal stress protein [Gaiellales bacterium]